MYVKKNKVSGLTFVCAVFAILWFAILAAIVGCFLSAQMIIRNHYKGWLRTTCEIVFVMAISGVVLFGLLRLSRYDKFNDNCVKKFEHRMDLRTVHEPSTIYNYHK